MLAILRHFIRSVGFVGPAVAKIIEQYGVEMFCMGVEVAQERFCMPARAMQEYELRRIPVAGADVARPDATGVNKALFEGRTTYITPKALVRQGPHPFDQAA